MVRCGFDKDTISVLHLAKTALQFCKLLSKTKSACGFCDPQIATQFAKLPYP
jgi:hypothetical protein